MTPTPTKRILSRPPWHLRHPKTLDTPWVLNGHTYSVLSTIDVVHVKDRLLSLAVNLAALGIDVHDYQGVLYYVELRVLKE